MKNFFEGVTTTAELTTKFQSLCMQHIADLETMNEISIQYSSKMTELTTVTIQPAKTPKVHEPWCKIMDYSEKSIVVTGFCEYSEEKGHVYRFIERKFLRKFNAVAPNKCKINVNLRDNIQGIIIPKTMRDAIAEVVDGLNKYRRPQFA